MTTDEYLSDLKKVKAALPNEFDRIVEDNKQSILDLNREDQLFDRGVDSDGKRLREYSPLTKAIKRGKGEVFNRTTLLDTGAFYGAFDLLNRGRSFSIFSKDSKSADLVEEYGNIFGLTKENTKRVDEEILRPKVNQYVIDNL